jgi:peptide/nickel transport system substrate-binding protein
MKDIVSVKAPDKWTVVFECAPGKSFRVHRYAANYSPIMPREVIEQNKNLADWKVSCGTGPFMMTEYVSGGHATFKRNPDYWQKDPLHPDNPIPYVDTLKRVFIKDISTQLAAIRSGKVDVVPFVSRYTWDDAEQLMKSNPELKWKETPGGHGGLAFAGKVTDPPYNDIRVRQALMLAIDHEAVAKDFYSGKARVVGWPVPYVPSYRDAYIPVEKLPAKAKALYGYNPETAKQLLAEAGYPNGFKTEVVTMQSSVDLLSIIKNYWAGIGVDLKIDIKERGAWVRLVSRKSFKHMCTTYSQPSDPIILSALDKGTFYNVAKVEDPRILEFIANSDKAWPDTPKQHRLLKEIAPYILEQAYYVQLPVPFRYWCWQPWVKAFNGEGYCGQMATIGHGAKYLWLDLDMKKMM